MLKNITKGTVFVLTETGKIAIKKGETISKDLVIDKIHLIQAGFLEEIDTAKEEAERLAKEEAERLAKEEAEKKKSAKPEAPKKSK